MQQPAAWAGQQDGGSRMLKLLNHAGAALHPIPLREHNLCRMNLSELSTGCQALQSSACTWIAAETACSHQAWVITCRGTWCRALAAILQGSW